MSIPGAYQTMRERYPEMVEAYERLGKACGSSGPLDAKTVAMVKLGMSIAAGLEGAAHSHTRKALEAGCTAVELLHIANLAAPTIGWPAMMRGREWVQDVTEPAKQHS